MPICRPRCWFAPEDLKIGERFRPKIDEAIRLHDKLLLVLSKGKIPEIFLRGAGVPEGFITYIRRRRHIGDFSEWKNRRVQLPARGSRRKSNLRSNESTRKGEPCYSQFVWTMG